MPSALRIEDLPPPLTPFVVTIDDYGFTGEGFVRLEDGWLSIRHAMPGEKVRVALDEEQRGGRRRFATLLEVLEPHPQRRDPLCDKSAFCKGCQIRHLSLQEEAAFKERTIKEVLLKFTDFTDDTLPPIIPIAPPGMTRSDGWRVRSALHYRKHDEHTFELGLRSPGRDALIPMNQCPALGEAARRLVEHVTQTLANLASKQALPPSPQHDDTTTQDTATLHTIRVAAPAHGRGFVELKLSEHEALPPQIFTLIEELDHILPEHVSVFVDRKNISHECIRGPQTMRLSLAGLTLELNPQDWFHATLEPAEVLYEQVEQWLEWESGERFLDVGCGIGTLSLMAARAGLHATGIDAKRTSIQSATHNAQRLGLGEHSEFIAGAWENALKKLWAQQRRFDVATINPMREPLGERALSYVNALGVERIIYLGPSPASTARDLGYLQSTGWTVQSLGGAMLHPATYHVMLVAQCRRTTNPAS